MYNRLLKTFIAVADAHSFTGACNHLYLSPPAVMKQINTLENELGIKLFDRSKSGLSLTKAGEVIYESIPFLIEYSDDVLTRAKEAESGNKQFRVGTSLLNPAKPFVDVYYRLCSEFSDYNLNLISFEDDSKEIVKEISKLGTKFDFLVGICDSRTWLDIASFVELGFYKKMVSVPICHRLAAKSVIDIEDLYGETLMMVPRGDSGVNDFLRNDLETNHKEITIKDTTQFYDLSVFNEALDKGYVLLTTECWKNIHPSLKAIDVNWNYRIPYGILYSKSPSESVSSFIDKVRELQERGDL